MQCYLGDGGKELNGREWRKSERGKKKKEKRKKKKKKNETKAKENENEKTPQITLFRIEAKVDDDASQVQKVKRQPRPTPIGA